MTFVPLKPLKLGRAAVGRLFFIEEYLGLGVKLVAKKVLNWNYEIFCPFWCVLPTYAAIGSCKNNNMEECRQFSRTDVHVEVFCCVLNFLFTNVRVNTKLLFWCIFSNHWDTYPMEAAVEQPVIFGS